MKLYCVGCGNCVFDGEPPGILCLTCACGAIAFIDDADNIVWPSSFYIANDTNIPHIEYYLGYSDHDSLQKTRAIETLVSSGSKWEDECEECRDNNKRRQDKLLNDESFKKNFLPMYIETGSTLALAHTLHMKESIVKEMFIHES